MSRLLALPWAKVKIVNQGGAQVIDLARDCSVNIVILHVKDGPVPGSFGTSKISFEEHEKCATYVFGKLRSFLGESHGFFTFGMSRNTLVRQQDYFSSGIY
jgi:hypothetical protein